MAVAVSKILAGAANIFVGVTAGVTGTPPTYIAHTNGTPATGTHVGATLGDAEFTYLAEKEEIDIEQELGGVDVLVKSEMAEISFECQEHTYAALQRAFDNVGSETVAGGDAFYFGGGTGILAPRLETVMLTAIQRNAPTKFTIAVLYKGYSKLGIKVPFGKAKRATYKVTLKGLFDMTRNAGDRMGYYRFEK